MSSMFKKKGGLAFKPKIPSARPRPPAPTTTTTTTTTSITTTITANDSAITKSIEVASPSGLERGPGDQHQQEQPSVVAAKAPPRVPETSTLHPSSSVALADVPAKSRNVSPAESQTAGDAAAAATADTSQDHLHNAEEHPARVYGHQNPTPPPSIIDSLIAPELRDKPTAAELLELAPLIAASTGAEAVPDMPSPNADVAPDQPTAKPTAPRSTRARRKAAEAEAEAEAEARAEAALKDGNSTGEGQGDFETTRPQKRQRRAAQDVSETPAPRQPRKRKASTTPNGTARPRRARSLTPQDAETQTVDLQKLKMTDLTKDLHIGKKFSRHDELRDRERQARLKAKLKGSGSRDASETPDDASAPRAKLDSDTPNGTSTPTPTPTPAGLQFRIVDGQIVVDQSSLVMDRHARANAARGEMETVEENDFTRLITSNSFMNTSKLRGPNIWTDEETELFYRGLRMFGTEFEMISRMFPNKQRRHVKLKYNREERHRPERITATICGEKTDKIDMDAYKLFTGMEFETVESIEAEHRKIREGFEAEQKRAADEQAEVMRRKREELFADDDHDDAAAGAAKKKAKRRGKQAVAYGLNGEPIVTNS